MPSKSIYTSNNGNVVAINFANPTLIIPVTAIAGSNFASITAKVKAGNNLASSIAQLITIRPRGICFSPIFIAV